MNEPLFYDSHIHTKLCHHAVGELREYVAVAEGLGLKGIIITDHNPMPDGYAAASRMTAGQFAEYLELVERTRRAWAGKVDVRLGFECDFAPGYEKFLEKQIAAAPFNYVLGSVHPHIRDYREKYWPGDPLGYQQIHFEHLALAAETGLFDAISHLDFIKNATPEAWDVNLILDSIRRCLDRIAKAGIAIELNTSGLYKEIPEMMPGPVILKEAGLRDIPVVVGSDAHEPGRVSDGFEAAFRLLEAAGYTCVSVFFDRQRLAIPLDQARGSLRASTKNLRSS